MNFQDAVDASRGLKVTDQGHSPLFVATSHAVAKGEMTVNEAWAIKLAVDYCEAMHRAWELLHLHHENNFLRAAKGELMTCDSDEYRAWSAQSEECRRIFEQWKQSSGKMTKTEDSK